MRVLPGDKGLHIRTTQTPLCDRYIRLVTVMIIHLLLITVLGTSEL